MLSRFLRSFRPCRSARLLLCLVPAVLLAGCTADWKPYVASDVAMTFVRRVSCITGSDYSQHPDNLNYRVGRVARVAGSADAYDFTILGEDGRFHIKRWFLIEPEAIFGSVGRLLKFNAASECAKRIDIPWSRSLEKPYYFEAPPQQILERNWSVLKVQLLILAGMVGVVIIGVVLCGNDPHVTESTIDLALFSALGVIVAGAIAVLVCGVLPWQAAKELISYYKFYDALPVRSVPLPIPETERLLAGPPHPNALGGSYAAFGTAIGILIVVWSIMNSSALVAGINANGAPRPTPKRSWHEKLEESTIAEFMNRRDAMPDESKKPQAPAGANRSETVADTQRQHIEAIIRMQVRRDLTKENYESQAADERDRFDEAEHQRMLAKKRRDKEQLQADRETLNAKHGLQAERVLKSERYALGLERIKSKIAEAHVGVAVARSAAGESPTAEAPQNKMTEAALLGRLVERKQREIAEAEADGQDTAEQRQKLALLTKLLDELATDGKLRDAKTD